jgi:ABC-type nitrate/sulfonate/bicarbonate transport system permease component
MLRRCYRTQPRVSTLGTDHPERCALNGRQIEGTNNVGLHAAQSLGAGRWEIFWEVILLGAFPSIVTGLSIGMGTCWFSLITAEMMAGQFGIGYLTWESYTLQSLAQGLPRVLAFGAQNRMGDLGISAA